MKARFFDGEGFLVHFWTSFGGKISVFTNCKELLDDIEALALPGWVMKAEPRHTSSGDAVGNLQVVGTSQRYRLLCGGRRSRRLGKQGLLRLLEHEMHMYLACYSSGNTFIHAGVVCTAAGLVVLPGYSFSGKSTLVRALSQAGASFWSDEYAVVDSSGAVHDFPRALSLRRGRGTKLIPAGDLGHRVGEPSKEIACVAFFKHKPTLDLSYRAITPGEGLIRLLEHTVSAQLKPAEDLQNLCSFLQNQPLILVGVRGEAEDAASALLRLLQTNASQLG